MRVDVDQVVSLPAEDALLVSGRIDGEPVEARGWISATVNHYDPGQYDANGNLLDGAKPRPMTDAEILGYCARVLAESASPATSATLPFSGAVIEVPPPSTPGTFWQQSPTTAADRSLWKPWTWFK